MINMFTADYWNQTEDNGARCELCPHRCHIPNNETGRCFVRVNRGGILVAASYGRMASVALDPIEKKPLNMFYPGKQILSIGSYGCNLSCPFCQNYDISMEFVHKWESSTTATPDDIVKLAIETIPKGNIGIAYTYNEPLVGYEFVRDTAMLAREAKLKNVLVTNGYINREPLEALLPLVDAMNIDLKGFSNDFYTSIGGDLETVKNTISLSRKY
jgi:pyruvate formate lyase activating enzyme